MNSEIIRRNPIPFPSFSGFSPFGSLMNTLTTEDLFNRGLITGFKDAFDSDFGVKIKDLGNGNEYRFGLPGISRENIKVDIDGDFLTVNVSEKTENGVESYSSRVSLSPTANRDEIKAKYENGLLTVVVWDTVTEHKPVTIHWEETSDKTLENEPFDVNQIGEKSQPDEKVAEHPAEETSP